MSYHARMGMPPLIVTGRTGACGNTKRTAGQPGRTSSGTTGTKSLPSAPRPCNQTTLQRGSGPVSRSMVSRSCVMRSALPCRAGGGLPPACKCPGKRGRGEGALQSFAGRNSRSW